MGATDPKGEADNKAAPKMPTAADVAKIPSLVRAHAVQLSKLDAVARAARRSWYAVRERFIAGRDVLDQEILDATSSMWEHERALAAAAAVHREHLDENSRRPAADRWLPTALYAWVALTQITKQPE